MRVPSPLVSELGGAPIRISLGVISGPEARRRARVLAGHATTLMMTMTDRKTVTNTLTALSDELATLGKEEMRASVSMLKYQSILHEAEDEDRPLDPEDLQAAQALESQHRAVKDTTRHRTKINAAALI